MQVTIDTRTVIRKFNDMNKRVIPVAYGVVNTLTRTGANMAQAYAPVDTGALQSNITHNVELTSVGVMGTIVSNPINGVPYNVYQEFGTGLSGANNLIHYRAKSNLKNPALKIKYNVDYEGFGAQPFMYPTSQYIMKEFGLRVPKAIKGVIK